jgi:predicted O-linked N-acetylglucosamine transferase (SPINDLY family)
MGHTDGSRPGILARRPAPVQLGFLGYAASTGFDFIDYLVSDRTVAPFEHAPLYSEKLVHLPDTYYPHPSHMDVAAELAPRPAHGLPEQGFVFCCFNNNYKIGPEFFACWMRLLAAVPGSVLWLMGDNPWTEANLRAAAAGHGIDPARLVFAERQTPVLHRARHRHADLFLDTLPYNAPTTATDALWMALPVLTLLGRSNAGRVAASLLRTVGLPQLVTSSLAEYEALALRLAHAPAELAALRAHLEAVRATTPLFDSARFTRHLEAAYERMHGIAAAGLPPEAFAVPPIG